MRPGCGMLLDLSSNTPLAICSAHTSLFDLVILTILGEDPDYTVFSSSYFVLYFIIPMVRGFKPCL